MRPAKLLFILLAVGWLMMPLVAASAPAEADSSTETAARERLAWLTTEIARHDELYFKRAEPEISDAAYDRLKRELQALEAAHPDWASSSSGPGDDRSGYFPLSRHRVRMLSLGKTYTEAEFRAFVENVTRQLAPETPTWVIEPKFDGLAISVTYENGRLTRAVTRGNGIEGDDVTANLVALAKVPSQLTAAVGTVPPLVELRGEVYMTWAEFNRINREREAAGYDAYAHPRNLAVGTLKQKTELLETDRHLTVVFYGMGAWEPETARPGSQQGLLQTFRAWGLPTVTHAVVTTDANEAWRAINQVGTGRKQLAFPIDGAVAKIDAVDQRRRLGETDATPRWAVAYKFPPDRVTTRVKAITWQVGRTGVLTPVVELEPVELNGSTVQRASLHNRQEVSRVDVRAGDAVWLEKAGEIIPAIAGVDLAQRPKDSVPYVLPENCPICGTKLVYTETTVRCPNYDCPAQVRRRLEYFVSDGAVDIDGVGRMTIMALVKQHLATRPADLYALSREEWRQVAPAKKVDRIVKEMAASRSRERWRFFCGIGIPDVGPAAAKVMARHFPDLTTWARATEADYANSRVSASARQAALRYFAEPARRADAEQLQRMLETKP